MNLNENLTDASCSNDSKVGFEIDADAVSKTNDDRSDQVKVCQTSYR
jgi:hypothetical protein